MNGTLAQAQIDAADAYENLFVPALFRQWAQKISDLAQIEPTQQVLDVACGTGILARTLAARLGSTGQVTGVDRNLGMLTVARRLAPGLAWQAGEAEALPFEADSFDRVLSQFGLMFFNDRDRALREMLRVLRPNGYLLIAVWDSLDRMPAYAAEVELVERLAGLSAAEALRAPFILGDPERLALLFEDLGASAVEITTHIGQAHFPSIRVMVEADLRGWLPMVGVPLAEADISHILQEAERHLAPYTSSGDGVRFELSAHLVTARKPQLATRAA